MNWYISQNLSAAAKFLKVSLLPFKVVNNNGIKIAIIGATSPLLQNRSALSSIFPSPVWSQDYIDRTEYADADKCTAEFAIRVAIANIKVGAHALHNLYGAICTIICIHLFSLMLLPVGPSVVSRCP
jgi:hypothetical protein